VGRKHSLEQASAPPFDGGRNDSSRRPPKGGKHHHPFGMHLSLKSHLNLTHLYSFRHGVPRHQWPFHCYAREHTSNCIGQSFVLASVRALS